MIQQLLVMPIVLPLVFAAMALAVRRWPIVQRALGVAGAGALLAVALALFARVARDGIQVVQLGNWPAPFGITLVADLFSAIMVLLAAIIGASVVAYSLFSIDRVRESFGYYPLVLVLLMGVCGAFLTGDIFNLYVWFEVMLIASFVLMALGGERAQMEGAIKYVVLNLVSSALFLAGVGILYGMAGTLNMADLHGRLATIEHPGLVTVVAMLFLAAFGIKAAVFPLFFWLPASYHNPPAAVSALFSGLLTKVGVYAILRVFTLLFIQDVGFTHRIILVIAGLTMVTGVLGAVAQGEFRRVLSFHIVSQIGYMIVGLGLFTPLALAGSIFYIVHHILVKANLFLVGGIAERLCGGRQLKEMGGLYRARPAVAAAFLVPALSLAGMPPLSGFFAKLILVQSALESRAYTTAAVLVGVGLLTLFSMSKIWNEAFWKPLPPDARDPAEHDRAVLPLLMPVAGLAAMTVAIGIFAEPLLMLSYTAAGQLLDPETYVAAVLRRLP